LIIKMKNKFLILGIFVFTLLIGFVSADCIQGFRKCEGDKVVECFGGSWTTYQVCLGSTPFCSAGKCITQAEAAALIESFRYSEFLDFGGFFMKIVSGKIWGTEEGIGYEKIREDMNRFSFTQEDAELNIGESSFKNIVPENKFGFPSFIETDDLGNITKADFTVNENGGIYLINGLNFKVPGNSRVKYDIETGFEFPEGTEIIDIEALQIDKEVFIKGVDLNFLNELVLNGDMSINDKGYFIKNGKAVYEGMEINADFSSGDILIATTSNKDKLLGYEGNLIEKIPDGLRIVSAKEGQIDVEFLKNSEIFDMGEYGKLKMVIYQGDEVKVERVGGLLSKISHKGSGGYTTIKNNGLNLFLTEYGKANIGTHTLTIDNILSGKYRSVPCFIESDAPEIPEEIRIDSHGKATGVIIKQIGGEFSEEKIYEIEPFVNILKNNLEHEDLVDIAEVLKDKERGNYILESVAYVATEATEGGFTNEQTRKLILEVIDLHGEASDAALAQISYAIKKAKGKINNEEFLDFTSEILGRIDLDKPEELTNLRLSYELLEAGIHKEEDLELTKSYINEFLDYSEKEDPANVFFEFGFIREGLEEYDGTNFGAIKKGARISSIYGLTRDSADYLDLTYSEINNKQDLSEQITSAINKYSEEERTSPNFFRYASSQINWLHDREHDIDNGADSIRQTIIEGLSFKSKYNLIASSEGTGDLYPSTFEGIYKTLPDNLVEEIKKTDPKYERLPDFVRKLSATGRLPEIYREDPFFYGEVIKDNLNKKGEALRQNAILMEDTIKDIYNNPKAYGEESSKFSEFFLEKYEEADTLEEKSIYGYYLKKFSPYLDEEGRTNKEILKITKEFPKITGTSLPKNWLKKDEFIGKLYFYEDEYSFYEAQEQFKSYGMALEKRGDLARLTKTINGKEIIIEMELRPTDIGSIGNIAEVIESQDTILTAHRGHCYHSSKTYPGPVEEGGVVSLAEKIFYRGDCGSAGDIANMQKKFPNGHIISDKNIGRGKVNNEAIYLILENIAKGELDWRKIKPGFSKEEGLKFPDESSFQRNVNRIRDYLSA